MSEQDSPSTVQDSGTQPEEQCSTSTHTDTEVTGRQTGSGEVTAETEGGGGGGHGQEAVVEATEREPEQQQKNCTETEERVPDKGPPPPQSTTNEEEEGHVPADINEPPVAEPREPLAAETVPQRVSVFQGQTLFEHEWKPEGNIKAIIHICHGLHEHMGRYQLLAEHLKNNGILVRGIDLVGHGRSGGDRGHIDSIESYVTDVINHIQDTKKEFPQPPLFLMGHSNGGAVAIGVTLRIQEVFTGLVLSAPAIVTEEGPLLKLAAKLIGFIAPQTGIKRFDEHLVSSIQEESEAYNSDPLVYRGSVKAGFGSALLKAIDTYQPRLQEITLPVLIIHGTDDGIVPIAASNLVITSVTSSDKTFERFDGSRHEILHDREQERARQLISQWLLSRLSGPVVTQNEPSVPQEDSPGLEEPVKKQNKT